MKDTQGFFFELTPDRVLEAVESSGILCTGRCIALNSFENRVYDVEIENEDSSLTRRIIKFYRPGRWSLEQIQDEHDFLFELEQEEIPVIAPLRFSDGTSIRTTPTSGIHYTLFPKVGGRAPEELSDSQLEQVGRLLARIHTVGAAKNASSRIHLDPETYGFQNLRFLVENKWIPLEFESRYLKSVETICRLSENLFRENAVSHRIHGDCHLGNLLWNKESAFFLDFDDLIIGPPVQDLWLLIPGRDAEAERQKDVLLRGYEQMRPFNRSSLRMIESLRALRFIHYTAWIARRWNDPAFPLAFPQFNTHQYWQKETEDLEDQVRRIQTVTQG